MDRNIHQARAEAQNPVAVIDDKPVAVANAELANARGELSPCRASCAAAAHPDRQSPRYRKRPRREYGRVIGRARGAGLMRPGGKPCRLDDTHVRCASLWRFSQVGRDQGRSVALGHSSSIQGGTGRSFDRRNSGCRVSTDSGSHSRTGSSRSCGRGPFPSPDLCAGDIDPADPPRQRPFFLHQSEQDVERFGIFAAIGVIDARPSRLAVIRLCPIPSVIEVPSDFSSPWHNN